MAPATTSSCARRSRIRATQSAAGRIGEIVSATTAPEAASIPSRQSSGTSAPARSWTITSASSTCPSSAARHASTEPGAPFEATTMDREGSANELDVEQLVHDPALLVVLGLGVDGPDVVVRPVQKVQRGEDRRPHRVVLVVVAIEADPPQLVGGQPDELVVGHLPDLVALEAEVLGAEAGRARLDQVGAPGAEV